ncbi:MULTISPECIES: ubiquinone biosynthesis regulatory protein kinase UbiB [unclassified Hahella]|uniref:ubiquinone biosynthesis regulatory protein kinase UbiB n=1 Tax=unclassified Hahella TaxID=2624107 RepID=UPI000FDD6D86|nr:MULTISPECIES: ubiquinone biosynthesis regulatory protein kinase UbiB [unclassified Hahella]AZZ94328.1 ubiquinone biosynthesis regulatory protein kinase UbiB [Hahella sp. KA22]MBU6953155.1 ubiquinone biosynthesis regulatory protein kinase UbiB [Hahella sp. HN01]MDG9669855.1 ubiquinone biosynthesis regulatory protein kinase UbiB [Hahella sp. CR1]QAY57702.1 ubiquinone biosynthesis regulatory protein kinase UbiB [Hahella sp. KA22]
MRRINRLIQIVWVICRYRLDEFAPLTLLPLPLRLLFLLAPWRLFPKPQIPRGERLRRALEELGPIFVKFGQILSTRKDLLPEDLADELKRLQDKVPPFASDSAVRIIEESLKSPISELFADFQTYPMASASIAQVHAATLKNGKEVVVKVIRPNIEKTIRLDIALMLLVARLVENYWEDGKRLHPIEVVRDYEHTILDELDLQREAANTSQLKRNFAGSELIYIPEVYWEMTHSRVLVMERIYGVPIADVEQLRKANVNMKLLAERGVEIFFTQVFRDSFFHADMHPGNIFVDVSNPANPRYIAIDCGIVGTLTPEDQSYLARNLLAFFRRDYRQVAVLHISSGWVPGHTRVNEFEAAIRTVCEPIFERPLKDISFGQFLVRLFQTARRFDMEVQPQLVLLQKTLLNIEGLGRQLYPDLDLWSTAQPFLENWMKQRIAPPGLLKAIKQHAPDWIEQTPELPQILYEAFDQLRHLDRYNQANQDSLASLSRAFEKDKQQRRDFWLAGLVLASAAAMAIGDQPLRLTELPWPSVTLAVAGLYLLMRPK